MGRRLLIANKSVLLRSDGRRMWHAWEGIEQKCLGLRGFGCEPEGDKPLGVPGCRLEGGLIVGLRGLGWDGVGWIHVA